jgi:hypothetical protein
MTTQDYVVRHVFPVAAALLPAPMSTPAAWAMLVAIGRQESAFLYRRQVAGRRGHEAVYGPARGFWQFEEGGGVAGVLEHPSTRTIALDVLNTLGYRQMTARAVHAALEHHDVLAAVFARLLLWTHAGALPLADDAERGWAAYVGTWRPGKPHHDVWGGHFAAAWAVDLPDTVRA